LFEFNNPANSLKSLLSGIWLATVPEFDGDANALFGAQLRIIERISLVGFGMAAKDSNHLLHNFTIKSALNLAHFSKAGRLPMVPIDFSPKGRFPSYRNRP
jgi:hypothetical protein